MAAYPDIDQCRGTYMKPIDGLKVSLAVDGTPHGKTEFSKTAYNCQLVHKLISETEKSTLMTFYDNNKNLTFTLDYQMDNDNYTMRFLGEPYPEKFGSYWTVSSKMMGQKT